MFNVRPDRRWFGFGVEPLEDPPGFRMNADGTVRDASPGDLSTAFLGIDPGDSAALPDGTMFNVQPGQNLPGLHNFRPPEELVPGFRMNADGSIRDASALPTKLNPDVGGNPFGAFDQLGTKAFTSVGDGTPPPYLAFARGEELKRQATKRGDAKRRQELETYSLANREQSFDAAAEQLAYLYRLMDGSWPKAVAAYNVGPGLKRWFEGANIDPQFFGAPERDKKTNQLIPTNKWTEEVPGYLRFISRGATEDPATGDMYVYQPPEQYRARDRIYRTPVPSDTRRNP